MDIVSLSRKNIKEILKMNDVIRNVEKAYKLKADNKTVVWPLVDYIFDENNSRMDIRSGYIKSDKIHGMKMLNNFPGNIEKGLQPFNGVLMIYDSNTGFPLGIMDAAHITGMRTGAAGAIGIKYLAREDAKKALILGAGKQAIFQIAALLIVKSNIEEIYIHDPLKFENAQQFVSSLSLVLLNEFSIDIKNIKVFASKDLKEDVEQSDIIITITPSKEALVKREWIKPGTHLSCVGADMPGKQEIDGNILRDALVFCDDIEQCTRIGEVELPLKNELFSKEHIKGEIGDLLLNKVTGRQNGEEITVFDTTGLAMLDLICGKSALDYAKENSIGDKVEI